MGGRVLGAGMAPLAPATDKPGKWGFRGPGTGEACVRRETMPLSEREREWLLVHSALTDERPLIAKVENTKVPPLPNGWVHGLAEVTGIAMIGAGAVMAFVWPVFGILTAVAGPLVTAGSLMLHERAASRRSRIEGSKHQAEYDLSGIKPSTDSIAVRFGISVGTIELIRHMPLEMEIKEKLLRALAGKPEAEAEAATIASVLEGVKARGEDLEFYSRHMLPQLIGRLDGGGKESI